MPSNRPRPPQQQAAQRHDRKISSPFLVAALCAIVAASLGWLGYQIQRRAAEAPSRERLRMSDAVELPPSPPTPEDDREAVARDLSKVESLRRDAAARQGDPNPLLEMARQA